MLHLYAVTHRQRKLSECVSKLRRRRGKPAMVASHAINYQVSQDAMVQLLKCRCLKSSRN